jgi:peptide methionine sulfoxide reductase MsrA
LIWLVITACRTQEILGTQYRSAIFVYSDTQDVEAKKVRENVNKAKKWKNPVVTVIEKSGPF